jgi:hypothetical protein
VIPQFIALTPCYRLESKDGEQWARRGTIYLNPAYIVQLTFSTENGRAQITLHDGCNLIVPVMQIAALVGLELA